MIFYARLNVRLTQVTSKSLFAALHTVTHPPTTPTPRWGVPEVFAARRVWPLVAVKGTSRTADTGVYGH